jgi:hypothetical protein
MAAGAWVFTNTTRQKFLNGTFVIPAGSSLKMALFTSASNITVASTTFAGCTGEVGTTNTGYSAGGIAVALTQSGTTTVTVVMTTAPVWTAGTANLTAKWGAIYVVSGDVIAFALLDSGGADVTATSGNTYTVGSNGGTVFTLA